MLPTLADLPNLNGKRVIVRGALNVPVQDGRVVDDFRLRKLLPTLQFLEDHGAVTIVIGHIGRDPKETLEPVFRHLQKSVRQLSFHTDVTSEEAKAAIAQARSGDVLLFENMRQYDGEKKNDITLAEQIAALGDFYINDAFAASHREHVSIVGLPALLPHAAGAQFADEVQHLTMALTPETPSLFILGGAKFDTKLPLLQAVVEKYNHIFIGGALANDFLRAQGHPVGASLVSDETDGIDDLVGNERIMLPEDVVVQNEAGKKAIRAVAEVKADEKILDIGPNSTRALAGLVKQSKFVLWNGPLGYYEGGFGAATEAIAEIVAATNCTSIVGGGDTVAAIAKKGLENDFTFLSTGGGAMLDFLADGSLPGVEALKASPERG